MTRLTCHHNKTMRSKTASAGFTMVELLAVVGILAIVGLIAVFSLGRLRLDLRQRELDSKAELLYTAAQKQMAELHAAGWEDWYQPGTRRCGDHALPALRRGRGVPENHVLLRAGQHRRRKGDYGGSRHPAHVRRGRGAVGRLLVHRVRTGQRQRLRRVLQRLSPAGPQYAGRLPQLSVPPPHGREGGLLRRAISPRPSRPARSSPP